MEGTNGDVYIEFHGDRLSSSGEQQLSKCENYPDHPFSSKHTVRNQNMNISSLFIFYQGFISYQSLRSWSYSFRIYSSRSNNERT